ncbi:MAG: rhomboid family intramembrane serine protease [Prevotella sp.]|nr:rhomboid family intramembrane serine protease [Prevotella sp.]MBQ9561559.1 rhomboid family intramembrane serine protease [Prevotella sp.]
MQQIPTITKNLLIINIICFLATVVMGGAGIDFNAAFGLHYWQATNFHLYQLVTYMFMHGGWTHLFFNMFALWMFGGLIERTFGERRYLIYYMVCGLGAALCQEVSQTVQVYSMIAPQGGTLNDLLHLSTADRMALNNLTTVGASGAIYGILLAFGMSYPEERMFVFPLPVPLKAKWFVIIYVAIELMSALSQRGDGVAHVAHLGGMLFGYIMIRMWRNSYRDYNYRTRHYSDGWDGYEIKEDSGEGILSKIRKWFHISNPNDSLSDREGRGESSTYNKRQDDWQYNAEKKKQETEIDRILDKIRRSGYTSLSEEEKKKLFDQSKFNK